MNFQRWRIELLREGITVVYGDGKYPQDPPRAASALEVALADAWRDDSASADAASMQAAFWRSRAIGLGADPDDWKRHERAAFAAE